VCVCVCVCMWGGGDKWSLLGVREAASFFQTVDGSVASWRELGLVAETNMAAIPVTQCKSDMCRIC
jgi:hypothetical protein